MSKKKPLRRKKILAEKLNGKFAMIGFITLIGAYLTTGQIIPGLVLIDLISKRQGYVVPLRVFLTYSLWQMFQASQQQVHSYGFSKLISSWKSASRDAG